MFKFIFSIFLCVNLKTATQINIQMLCQKDGLKVNVLIISTFWWVGLTVEVWKSVEVVVWSVEIFHILPLQINIV